MFEWFNNFLGEWQPTVAFLFSMISCVFIFAKLSNFIRARIDLIVQDAVNTALIDQRQNYQAEAIDELLKLIRGQQEDIRRYSKAKEDDAINSAICRKILEDNNVTIVD